MKTPFAVFVALGLLSVPAQATIYQFTGPFDVTFRVEGEQDGLPSQALFALSITGTAPAFDPFNKIGTETWYDATATVRVFDGRGDLVPQPPSSRLGNDMHIYGANCLLAGACQMSFGGYAGQSSVMVSALDQIIRIVGDGYGFNYQNFAVTLTANVPNSLVPVNLVQNPIPAALPLFASVLGIGAWFARRFSASPKLA